MSILSTNHRLISIGESYSAGNGIDITDQVISVTGDATPYSAGDNIDIQDHIISGKDWSQDITEASSHAYNETTAWVQENYANSADMTYISAVVDTKLDASAWSTVSADYATEDYVIMADNITYNRATGYVDNQQFAKESACQSAFDYLNTNKLDASSFTDWQNGQYSTDLQTIEGQIANKYDTSSFAEVSGNFQPKGDYAERDFVLSSIEFSTSGKLDVSSFAGVSGDFLTTSFEIPESAAWNDVSTTVQTNSAQWAEGGGDAEVNSFVYDNSATINDVNTSYQTNSGTFLTAVDLSPYYTTAEAETLSSMFSGAIDYISANAGDDFPASADEAIQAYQTNSSTYLTSHQDISYLMPKSESANFYPMTGNPSGFINDVEFEEINLSSFATSSQISALSGAIDYVSANAGGDVPTGTMNVSGLEYNAVNEISAYNGSAIAQYGAEKQWLVHDDTIVHISNSAQYAFGCNVSAIAQLLGGNDETVLFSGSLTGYTSAKLSESVNKFNRVKVFFSRDNASIIPLIDSLEMCTDVLSTQLNGNFTMNSVAIDLNNMDGWCYATVANITNDVVSAITGRNYNMAGTATFDGNFCLIKRVIGIGRKA